MTKDEALKQALEALNDLAAWNDGEVGGHMDEPYAAETARRTITAIKETLAQPAPYMAVSNDRMTIDPHTGNVSIGTVVQRTWVDLTDDEIDYIMAFVSPHCDEIDFARAIEAKLKDKNT
jgi:hypothetical protein